jgi:hypothetical protein
MKDANRFLLPVLLTALSGCLAGTPEQFFAYDLSRSSTSAAFKNIKPAVAVRGASCLMCHANVQSNLITDFGYGDSWFIDHANNSRASGSYYFNHELSTWQTANIAGSLIVPRATISRTTHGPQLNSVDPTAAKSEMSLKEFLSAPSIADLNGHSFNGGGSMSKGVAPVDGQAIVEKNHVEIKAPMVSDILEMAPDLVSAQAGYQQRYVAGIPAYLQRDLSGLHVEGSGAQQYVRNAVDQPLVCAGDIIIKGTLFLKDLNLVTSTYGCHLYVSGSVFIQGAITINGGNVSSTESLQITSGRAVMMGFNPASVRERMALPGSTRAWTLPNSYTRGVGTNSEKHTAIYNESMKIADLQDGAEAPISYKHVLLNAPEIHSRYAGGFQGALVGEIIIFVLSQFAFTYDPIFEQIPVLPALNIEILKVE